MTPCNKIVRVGWLNNDTCIYRTFYRLPSTDFNKFASIFWWIYFSKKQEQIEAKSLLRGHCPLCATWRFIGALVLSTFGPTCGPGPSKPTAFLGLSSPNHEVANDEGKRASPCCFQLDPRASLLCL